MISKEQSDMFKEEASDLLEELESALLELENNTDDLELVKKIFRALHTIKGSGSMFGFEEIASFAHEFESIFDLVREGKIKINKEMIDLGLASQDMIKKMLDNCDENADDVLIQKRKELIQAINKFNPAFNEKAVQIDGVGVNHTDQAIQDANVIPITTDKELSYRIRFKPSPDLLNRGTQLQNLIEEIMALGRCHVVAQSKDVPALEELAPNRCYVYWDIILTTSHGINAIKDIFIFIDKDSQVKVELIDDGNSFEEESDYKKLGHILVERGDLTVEDIEHTVNSKKRLGELLVEQGLVEPAEVEAALAEQNHIRELRKNRLNEEIHTVLKVPAERADMLVNLVGELVTMQARLSQISDKMDDPTLLSIAEEAERLIWDIRDNTMSMRMLPFSTNFSRFTRLIRDLSQSLNKNAELILEGGETELDKTVIEKLNDPLLHIIRNCIDHGMEFPEERVKKGKPAKGTIRIGASYSGAYVSIVIEDDGKGIDPEIVKAKAVEKGLIKPGVELSEKEVYALLFEPGFSTSNTVTNISGRGVGMDVIKKNIESLRGSVQIVSRKGEGTTLTLEIPLTLAIIDGLWVDIHDENFIIPLSMVEEIVELTEVERAQAHDRNFINIRGKIVPYISLREFFDFEGTPPAVQQIVITQFEDRKVGFVVDRVNGQHQTVIKSLGNIFRNIECISGATIMGDGSIALILDISKLSQLAETIGA